MLRGYFTMRLNKLLPVTLVLSLVVGNGLAQQRTGTLKGTVADQLGSLIVNATILLHDARGAERKTATNSSGIFEFRGLPAGKYDLKVVATGFDLSEQRNVEVTPGRTTTLELQLSISAVEQSVTVDQRGVSTDSDRNADAIILRGRDLEALPSDPEALAAALQAMAGPTTGENGAAQVKVDGFSNGQIPPKEAIREIRVNQNPYSAENEYPGWGGIEIFTQPGSEKLHGGVAFGFNDESLNTRNPFAPVRAPFQQRSINANLSGPIVPKRASFAAYLGRSGTDSNAIVNATILDAAFKPVRFNQTFVTPQTSTYASGRSDLKLNNKHTLVGNYEYNQYAQNLQGIGGFALPSRATTSRSVSHTLQLTETAVLSEKMINETRLQLSHNVFQQRANITLRALNVQDSFYGGGAQTGVASNRQDRAEVQNFLSWSTGNHFLKIGERLRYVKVTSISPANFNGTYTFAGGTGPQLDANDQVVPGGAVVTISSLERYRRTEVFRASGKSAAEIRSLGGGATQFSIAGGNPQASVRQTDVSLYFQDEWKVRPNFTLSPGLRYENQNNIESNWNFAPRIAFAWSPASSRKNQPEAKTTTPAQPGTSATAAAKPAGPAAPAPPKQSKTVIRGGIGIFYNRIQEGQVLDTRRFNGFNQQQFVVTDPAVLDSFPIPPLISTLEAFAQPQTRRLLGLNLAPSLSLRSSFSVERQLPHGLRLTLSYSHAHTLRTGRTVNINAPLAGTFNPAIPTSGVRPLGQASGNILESQSSGRFVNDSLSVNLYGNTKRFSFGINYTFGKSRSTDGGTSGSSFNPYDFSNEWGRAGFDARHFLWASAGYQARHGFSINSFVVANTGRPYNITTGHDTNGDTFFSERPAFATDLSKPGVIVTPLGAFDPNPALGQQIIPRNFGQGPGFISANIGASKTIKFGPAIAPKSPPPAGAGNVVTTSGNVTATTANAQKKPEKPVIQRPYQLSFSIFASNALNHASKGNPVGNMASPSFLKSTTTSNISFFGPGGGGSGGNRQLTLRVRFSF
jgi:hypothetical protein